MNNIKRFWFSVLIIIFLGLFLFFSPFFFGWFVKTKFFTKTFTERVFSFQEFKRLQAENVILRGELERLRKDRNVIIFRGGEGARAAVYSNYPFNDKNFLVIDYGKNDGAETGRPVVFNNFLVGEISQTQNSLSTVKTIFDPSWVSGVMVGKGGLRAVLRGGLPPRLELVPHDFEVKKGEIVYNTSPNFPLNAPVGEVQEANRGSGKFWEKVVVKPLFQRDELLEVLVLTSFP